MADFWRTNAASISPAQISLSSVIPPSRRPRELSVGSLSVNSASATARDWLFASPTDPRAIFAAEETRIGMYPDYS